MSPGRLLPILLCLVSLVNCQNRTTQENGTTEINTSTTPVPKTFKEEEKEVINAINSVLRRMLPYVIQNSEAVSISPHCTSAMMKTFVNIRKLKGWTLQLLDSIGKPAAGMLRGTSYSMGDYDQCLDISVRKGGASDEVLFTGKYCHILSQASPAIHSTSRDYKTGKINGSQLGKMEEAIDAIPYVPMMSQYMTHLFGICIPSVCTEEDMRKIFTVFPFPGNLTVTGCEVKEEIKTDYQQRLIIGFFGFFFLLVIAGTLTDTLIRYANRNSSLKYNKGKLLSIAVSFSIYSNVERFCNENQGKKRSHGDCFRGLVFGSIICIIFSHTYFLPYDAFYRQAGILKNLEQYLSEAPFAAVISLSLAVETLFICIGFLISYNYSSESDGQKEAPRANIFKTIFYYYVRLCIPLMFCIGTLFLLPLIGSGPLWHDVIDNNIAECRVGWWTYLAMYSNFQSIREQCFPHLWLVPCLMQTTAIASLFTWVSSRCFKFGISLLLIAMLGCNISVGLLTYWNNLPPSYVPYFVGNVTDQFWETSFSTPLVHFSSCGIGVILGVLVTKKPDMKLTPVFLLLGWILSVGFLCGVVFLLFPLRLHSDAATVWTALYAALHRTCFSASIGWIALACALGYGGFINSLLSIKALDPLYRISYFAYLIHFFIITYHIGVARERFYYSHLELVLRGFSYSCVTYILSYICHILIEMPIRSIKYNILSTTEQIVLNNYSNGLKQVDILRSINVRVPEHKLYNTSFSPGGSDGARRH